MKHAREDYNRIQDPAGLIPENEPVFLLRAQDKHAPEVVAFWASLVHREGGDGEIANMAMRQSRAMKDWQHAHGKKVPDLPEGTVPQPVKQANWLTAARLVVEATPEQLPLAIDALRDLVDGAKT